MDDKLLDVLAGWSGEVKVGGKHYDDRYEIEAEIERRRIQKSQSSQHERNDKKDNEVKEG